LEPEHQNAPAGKQADTQRVAAWHWDAERDEGNGQRTKQDALPGLAVRPERKHDDASDTDREKEMCPAEEEDTAARITPGDVEYRCDEPFAQSAEVDLIDQREGAIGKAQGRRRVKGFIGEVDAEVHPKESPREDSEKCGCRDASGDALGVFLHWADPGQPGLGQRLGSSEKAGNRFRVRLREFASPSIRRCSRGSSAPKCRA